MDYTDSSLQEIILHKVGNKLLEEDLRLSKFPLRINEDLGILLANYFFTAFKSQEFFNFYHESDLHLNEVYVYASEIFENPDSIYEQSVNLAKHLYEQSIHPKIKGGEFYTVYFRNCMVDGRKTDAVGLFKCENKDTFLKVLTSEDGYALTSEKGMNLNKLDKGCIIFNLDKEDGYIVSVVDNTNRGSDAQYWIDDFLHVSQRKDEYYNTQNVLNLCKTFVTKELPEQFDVTKADQVDLLNRSVKFFKSNDSFDLGDFENEVIIQPEIIESFKTYKSDFQKENDIEIADNFSISESAVKKQSRIFKSVIKLDKNFHIYIHGDRKLIEQGEDEHGRKFYKIYYNEEN